MYRKETKEQIEFHDFILPFSGTLNRNNRWIKLAEMIPWDEFEEKYAKQFSGSGLGAPAKSFRIALGSLIIKEKMDIPDEEVVEQIRENHYLQYFIGKEEYRDELPFDSSMMVHFRKRITAEMLNEINERIHDQLVKKNFKPDVAEKTEATTEPTNKGKLLVDATCAPADIQYPCDLSLLNEAREKTELIIDILHKSLRKKEKKVRTYRIQARKEYLKVSKKRKKSEREIRKAIRKQLGYVKRNLAYINEIGVKTTLKTLNKKRYRNLLVCTEVYRQQQEMYNDKTHRIEDRIVSISQPHVRPIVRGKAGAAVEFGAKMTISVVDGFTFIEKISWDNYNEGTDLIEQIENYRKRFGYYPESVHIDKIYQTRKNRQFCKKHTIRISGPQLGRPPKEKEEQRDKKRQRQQDEKDRIPVEGKFGNAKRKYGLNRIMAKGKETSETTIAVIILIMNLEKLRVRFLFVPIYFQCCNIKKAEIKKFFCVYTEYVERKVA